MTTRNPTKSPKSATKQMRPVRSSATADQRKLAYKTLRESGMPARMIKRVLGYADGTAVASTKTIDQQRDEALKDLKITIKSQFKTLKEIRDDKTFSCASDRINAVKTINNMVPGFSAPQQVQVNNTAVMFEFRKTPSAELSQLAHELRVALQPDLSDIDDNEAIDAEYEECV